MLIDFSVGNYRSIKKTVTLSMVAANIQSKDKELDRNNVFELDQLSLLKSAAIYGANSSGKSNLCRALQFMRRFVLNSSKETQVEEPISVEPFRLDAESEKSPSYFQVIFMLDGRRVRYGFEIDEQRVVSEWLFHVPKSREVELFTRDGKSIVFRDGFREGRGIVEKTRANSLFLSVAAQFNGAMAQAILIWFRRLNVMSGLEDEGFLEYTLKYLHQEDDRKKIVALLRALDLGLDDIVLTDETESGDHYPKEMPADLRAVLEKYSSSSPSLKTIHRRVDQTGDGTSLREFDLHDHESAGTQKLVALAGPLLDTLEKGKLLVIDEFDARLHPLISCAILRMFNSRETNPHNAQLIFTTHDTNLLNNRIFRRDQIWFTEKDRGGATHLTSLVEYRVRNDASFDADYVRGKYGAIPFLDDLAGLPEHADA